MKTSSFKKYKGNLGVSIALYSPNNWDGPKYLALAPSKQLFYSIKTGKINEEEYENGYHKDVLSKLDPEKIYEDLKENVILCWEDYGEFCHRHIIARWLEKELGIEILEWDPRDENLNANQKPLF